eukprot:scaffold175506_cov14-Tisochrysis_lutea.AAC.1
MALTLVGTCAKHRAKRVSHTVLMLLLQQNAHAPALLLCDSGPDQFLTAPFALTHTCMTVNAGNQSIS